MKKLILILFLLNSLTLSAQITKLSELISLSKFLVSEITESLQYDFKVSRPYESIKDGVAIGIYTYSKNYGKKTQIIHREIRRHLKTSFILESTRLTSNDKELYKSLLKDLELYGYKLNFKTKENKLFYSKGKNRVIVYPTNLIDPEISLTKGYYIFSIPRNNAKFSSNESANEDDGNKIDKSIHSKNISIVSDPYGAEFYFGEKKNDGFNLRSRKVEYTPPIKSKCKDEGRVIIKIEVDKNGITKNAYAGAKGSTNKNPCLLKIAKEIALETKWSKASNAPDLQIGYIKLIFTY